MSDAAPGPDGPDLPPALDPARWPTQQRLVVTALGRNGVPVYVLYRPGRAPLLLPEVLQTKVVEDALATL